VSGIKWACALKKINMKLFGDKKLLQSIGKNNKTYPDGAIESSTCIVCYTHSAKNEF